MKRDVGPTSKPPADRFLGPSGGGTLTGERSYGEVEWPADKFDTLGIFRIGALDAACRLVSILSAWDLVTLVYVSD